MNDVLDWNKEVSIDGDEILCWGEDKSAENKEDLGAV